MSTRVMIIDNQVDDLGGTHADVLAKEFRQNFCQVMQFNEGDLALEAYGDFQPHLIISEEVLADKVFGWDIAYSILSPLSYTVKPCYFVALLSRPTRRNTALLYEFGFDEVVPKFRSDGISLSPFTLMGFVTKAKARSEEYNNRYNPKTL